MRIVLTHVLHVLSKGLRVAVQSGSIQWCTRTIHGVWVLANQTYDSDRARSRGEEYHIRWKPVKTTKKDVLKFQKMWDVKRMMFYWHTKFQVEKHYEM